MAYSHRTRVHRKHRQARKVGFAAFGLVLLVTIGAAIVGIDWFRNQQSSSNTIVSTANTTSVQSANINVLRSEFFQFQATDDWTHVYSESNNNRFVYVKNDDFLITQRLVVYVDRSERAKQADMKLTNVVPVTIEGNKLNPVAPKYVSDHCSESWPKDLQRNPSRIVHDNVSFVCAPDSNQYNVLIGEDGGSDDMKFIMSDGKEIELTLVYSDLTAYPGTGELFNIIQSFEVL